MFFLLIRKIAQMIWIGLVTSVDSLIYREERGIRGYVLDGEARQGVLWHLANRGYLHVCCGYFSSDGIRLSLFIKMFAEVLKCEE